MRASTRRMLAIALGSLVAALVACDAPRGDACPPPTRSDATKTARLVHRLGSTSEGVEVLAASPAPRVCFGAVPVSGTTPDGTILLDADAPDALAAARLAHLLRHAKDGVSRANDGKTACDAWVAARLEAEARAYGLELRVARALGEDPAYAFVDAYWRAPPGVGERAILEFIREHPYGGGGIDALAAGYSAECRAP